MELTQEKIYVVQPEYCIASELPTFIKGLGKQQCKLYVAEMYQHPDFHDDVIKPTQKTTVVNINRFIEFLKAKEEERFRGRVDL